MLTVLVLVLVLIGASFSVPRAQRTEVRGMLTAVRSTLSRRQVILGSLCLPVLAATACTDDPEPPPPDPDRVALENALEVEQELYVVVGNLKAAGRDAVMVFGAVEAHVQALDTALGDPPSMTVEMTPFESDSPTPSSLERFVSVDEAVRAADRAVNAHLRALRSASAVISPLLASVAASDAAIAAYLRGAST